VNKLSIKLVEPRATTIINTVVQFPPHRSHGQCAVIVANMIAKCSPNWVLNSKKVIQFRRRWLKRGKAYFALIAAHAKFRIDLRRFSEALIKPVKCLARWALNVHLSKIMNTQSRVKRAPCKREKLWKWWWSKRKWTYKWRLKYI